MKSENNNNSFRAAIIQHPPVFLNLDESTIKACKLIEEAANSSANVIVFPETWLPGYPIWLDISPKASLWDYPPAKALYRLLADNSMTIPGPGLDNLLETANKTGTYIVMGAHERRGGTLFNIMLFLHCDGKQYWIHRKLVPTYTERLVWGQGDGSTLHAMETEYGVVGGLICWEHWMPLARAVMHSKNEIFHVAQWPSGKDLHQLCSRHYAFEGQCFVAAAGVVISKQEITDGFGSLGQPDNKGRELLEAIPGDGNDFILKGGSAIIAPDASYIVEPVYDRSEIIYADINPDLAKEGHLTLDTDGHYSRPDVFQLNVNTTPQTNVAFDDE